MLRHNPGKCCRACPRGAAAGARRSAVLAVLLLLLPLPLLGQVTFYAAYEQGLEHERAGRWQEARQAFQAAAELRSEPGSRVKTYGLNFLREYDPYLHLVRAELELGLLEEASTHLQQSATAGVSPAEELAQLRHRLEQLRTAAARPAATALVQPTPSAEPPSAAGPTPAPVTPTRLDLTSKPGGADLFVDGRLVATTPVLLPIDPGTHRLELRLEGFTPHRESFSIAVGATQVRTVILAPAAEPTAPAVAGAPATGAQAATIRRSPTPAGARPQPAILPPAAGTPSAATSTPPPASPTSVPPADKAPAAGARHQGWQRPALIRGTALVVAAALALAAWLWNRRSRKRPPITDTNLMTIAEVRRTITLSHTTPLPEGMDPHFDGYRLLLILGRGGMATTYLAERGRDKLAVAIKIPHGHLLDNRELVDRFVREGALGATVHHPNIIRIFEAATVRGTPFIAMEFLDGVTLEQQLAAEGAFDLRRALETARSIALALDYAHMKGIIHRDLKPENVMILRNGTLKVMDYGIARIADAPGLTATHTYLGTPLYSAPESLTPNQVDQRSDLYSLGIILYRLLSNRLPFESSSPLELLEMHRSKPLPPLPRELRLPPPVIELVARLTAKRQDDRYPSAEVFLREVNGILNEL